MWSQEQTDLAPGLYLLTQGLINDMRENRTTLNAAFFKVAKYLRGKNFDLHQMISAYMDSRSHLFPDPLIDINDIARNIKDQNPQYRDGFLWINAEGGTVLTKFRGYQQANYTSQSIPLSEGRQAASTFQEALGFFAITPGGTEMLDWDAEQYECLRPTYPPALQGLRVVK